LNNKSSETVEVDVCSLATAAKHHLKLTHILYLTFCDVGWTLLI